MQTASNLNMPDISACRDDFPVLKETMNGRPLAYLDSAASAQKPKIVIDTMREVMENGYANIHRGLYRFSQDMTRLYEGVRPKVAEFINARHENEIVFTRNTTEAINLIAHGAGRVWLKEGEEILLTEMEHHANIVPWQLLRDQIKVNIRVLPVLDDGSLDLEALKTLLTKKTRLFSLTHVSNVLGTINPIKEIIKTVREFNPEIKIVVDGSQGVVHGPVDVQDLGCDFYVFTGHKLYGPTGVGVLWGKPELLDQMPPYQGGGDMIERVTFEQTTYKAAPARFEAGTPAIVEVIGLGAAVDYVRIIGMDTIAAHEQALFAQAMETLAEIEGLKIYGTAPGKAGIISFTADWAHTSDIAMILDQQGVAVRSGHHCCMPLMDRYNIEGTIRASLGLYSNADDIAALGRALTKAKEMLA